jgi:hypothetical protein
LPIHFFSLHGCFVRKKSGLAVRLSLLATLLTLSFLLFGQIIHDEAGHYSRITGYGPGYWLWVASAATAFLGGLCLTNAKRKGMLTTLADTSGWCKR